MHLAAVALLRDAGSSAEPRDAGLAKDHPGRAIAGGRDEQLPCGKSGVIDRTSFCGQRCGADNGQIHALKAG